MIRHYAVTQIGAYHIKEGSVCQDAHCFKALGDRFAIGAVADGVGSAAHAEIASQIAVTKSVGYCAERIKEGDAPDAILRTIRESFSEALSLILAAAEQNGHDAKEYDTTLVLAVFLEGSVYFGAAGDSGIIAQLSDGRYEPLTEQQRDEDGCVFPLCFEDRWIFGQKGGVVSVLLATDGIYDTFFPFLLRNNEQPLYIALIHYMASEEALGFSSLGEEGVQSKMEAFLASIPDTAVNDDKTVLLMLDPASPVSKQPADYYKEPDFAALKKKRDEEYRRMAYPTLYKDKPNGKENDDLQRE